MTRDLQILKNHKKQFCDTLVSVFHLFVGFNLNSFSDLDKNIIRDAYVEAR